MITTTKAGVLVIGAAAVAASPFFVEGGPLCPADPVPCHSPLDFVPAFTGSTATTGPGFVALPVDYAAAEVVVDDELMRAPAVGVIRSDDA